MVSTPLSVIKILNMKISFYHFCLFSLIVLMGSCVDDVKTDDPAIEKDYMEFSTSVIGFSGICFSKDKSSFLVASDKLGLYELNFDGSTKRQFKYSGHKDLEGITINPTTGIIYVADETNMTLNQLSDDEISMTEITKIVVPNGLSNKGIEGLTYGKDTLYAVNQTEPTLLIKYSLVSKKEISRTKVNFATYLSDICYDSSDNTLWICDSQQKKIFHCKLNAELIATQAIDFVPKAEAIAIDRSANIAWIGCDQTGNLYKVKIKI